MTSKALRNARSTEEKKVEMEKRIYISLPKIEDHSFHLTGKVSNCCTVHLYYKSVEIGNMSCCHDTHKETATLFKFYPHACTTKGVVLIRINISY